MTCLITGATGFMGQALLRELIKRGEEVIAVSRHSQLSNLENLVSWHQFPETPMAWEPILEHVSTIYHFAWSSLPQTSNEDPLSDASDNILASLRLVEAAKKKRGLRVVFASSGGTVYGALASVPVNEQHETRPRCAYGVSKLAVEKYLTLYHDVWGLDCIALRISNAYGPGQKVGRNFGAISTFASQVNLGETITIFGDGATTRDYLYIDDLIEALIAAGNHRGGPTIVNIGSGTGKSLNDIIDVLCRVSSRKVQVQHTAGRDFDVPISVLDVSLAEAVLKWKPRTSFEVGIESTWKALRGT